MYRQNRLRNELASKTATVEDYLGSLETVIEVAYVNEDDVVRAAQMTQKTNQFNMTTRRYTENEIRAMMMDKSCHLFIASVSDRFGDNGKCVLAIVRVSEEGTAEVDTLLMSCRVMGRYVEDLVIGLIEDKLASLGIKTLDAAYIPTRKNIPVANLFERLGYDITETDETGTKKYRGILGSIEKKGRKFFGTASFKGESAHE
jgi:FkbH-like protein